MITRLRHGVSAAAITLLCVLAFAFPAFAVNMAGGLDEADSTAIEGWAIDEENPDKSAQVVLCIYTDGATTAKELARVTADQYRTDLDKLYGNGNHAFSYPVDWNSIEGSSFIIQAYVIPEGEQPQLLGSREYKKAVPVPAAYAVKAEGPSGTSATAAGDAVKNLSAKADAGTKGTYLGKFTTTAYCTCGRCSSAGTGLTYSETVPKANHTISADLSVFPIGTKLMIGDTIYTVEDTGVSGNRLDIYFSTHQSALNYGRKTVDVYSVE